MLKFEGLFEGAEVRGTVFDKKGNPIAGVPVVAQAPGCWFEAHTGNVGSFRRPVPPGSYLIVIDGDQAHGLVLELKPHEVVTIHYQRVKAEWQLPSIVTPEPTPAPTLMPLSLFQVTSIKVVQMQWAQPPLIKGTITGLGDPARTLEIVIEHDGERQFTIATDRDGSFQQPLVEPGAYRITLDKDEGSQLVLYLGPNDVAEVSWQKVPED